LTNQFLRDLRVRFYSDLKYYNILKRMPLKKRLNIILFNISPELHRLALKVWVAVKTTKPMKGK